MWDEIAGVCGGRVGGWLRHGGRLRGIGAEGGGGSAFSRLTSMWALLSAMSKAAAFYTEAGVHGGGGFDVPAEMAGNSGLTDYRPFKVRVFVLGGETATRIKLMEIDPVGPRWTIRTSTPAWG